MANAMYDLGRQGILDGTFNWASASIKVALVDSTYSPSLSADEFVSDLGAHIVARSGALASKTETAGVARASNVTISAVTGSQVKYLVIYEDTGTDSTSRLIACIDTATGLPVTPNGGDITITWDTGSNGIFKL